MLQDYLVLYGIAIPLLIAGLVGIAKTFGLEKRYAYLLSLVLGMGVAVGHTLIGDWPVFEAIIVGMVLGLIAMGLYDVKDQTEKLSRGE